MTQSRSILGCHSTCILHPTATCLQYYIRPHLISPSASSLYLQRRVSRLAQPALISIDLHLADATSTVSAAVCCCQCKHTSTPSHPSTQHTGHWSLLHLPDHIACLTTATSLSISRLDSPRLITHTYTSQPCLPTKGRLSALPSSPNLTRRPTCFLPAPQSHQLLHRPHQETLSPCMMLLFPTTRLFQSTHPSTPTRPLPTNASSRLLPNPLTSHPRKTSNTATSHPTPAVLTTTKRTLSARNVPSVPALKNAQCGLHTRHSDKPAWQTRSSADKIVPAAAVW